MDSNKRSGNLECLSPTFPGTQRPGRVAKEDSIDSGSYPVERRPRDAGRSEWPGFPRLSLCFRVKENSISAQSSVLTAHWRSPLSSSLMFLCQPRMRSVIITLQPRGSGFALPQRHMHFLFFWKRFLMLPVRGQRRGTAICPALILYL